MTTNAGVVAWYRKRLKKELDEMHHSVCYWLQAAYRARESEIVGDASPTRELLDRFSELSRRWLKRWNLLSKWLGKRAVEKVEKTTTVSMKEAFKAAGFTVKFDKNRNINETTLGLIAENVNLITSIPRHYLSEVEGIVLRGLTMGRDYAYVAEELRKRYGISERRAAMIARDQLDKATQAIQRTRDKQLGITEGIWVHMPGQYTSRETHKGKHMNGQRFKLDGPEKGLYDPDPKVARKVLPGELICCRCSYRRVLPDYGKLEVIRDGNGK